MATTDRPTAIDPAALDEAVVLVRRSGVRASQAKQAPAEAGGVGAGLTIAGLTNTCAMDSLLAKLPYNRGASCDIDAVGQLASTEPGPA